MLNNQRERVFDDLLQAERSHRHVAEKINHEFIALLTQIATRLDGSPFEELRRKDPSIPGRWTLGDWGLFFAEVQSQKSGWGARPAATESDQKLESSRANEELAELRAALAKAQADVSQLEGELKKLRAEAPRYEKKEKYKAPPVAEKPARENGEDAVLDETLVTAQAAKAPKSYSGILTDLRQFLQNVPPPELAYKPIAEQGRDWRRYAGMIYMIGRYGLSSAMELRRLMGDGVVGLPKLDSDEVQGPVRGSSGSLGKLLENLKDYGFLVDDMHALGISKNGFGLLIYRLTPAGEVLYQTITGQPAVESEWSKLIRLHEGARFTEHTAACLAFAVHARRCGWSVEMLPTVEGHAVPDVLVSRENERTYVEVEINTNDKLSKWKNLAELNGGFAAVCARTFEAGEKLGAFCKTNGIKLGLSTDLATLFEAGYYGAPVGGQLWQNAW